MSGTTSDKLNLLLNTKAEIKQAIINKGVSVSDSDTFASYAAKIGQINSGATSNGTLPITSNGTYNVSSYEYANVDVSGSQSTKYGATVDTFIGDIDTNGVLSCPVSNAVITLNGVTKINSDALSYKFCIYNSGSNYSTGIAELLCPDLVEIGDYGMYGIVQNVYNFTTFTAPLLTSVNILGLAYAFAYTNISSIDFESLSSIGAQAFFGSFRGISSLSSLYFRALTTTSFGSYINQFNNMFDSSTGSSNGLTVHFPSNLQATIQGLNGYPTFGGDASNITMAFDLPATS